MINRQLNDLSDVHLQHVIETLILAPWQFVYAHMCHPEVCSSAFNIPASNNGLVTIPFVMKNLPNFMLDVVRRV